MNRIKNLEERIEAIELFRKEIEMNLFFGWNPVIDPKCLCDYNPYLNPKTDSPYIQKQKKLYDEAFLFFYNKH